MWGTLFCSERREKCWSLKQASHRNLFPTFSGCREHRSAFMSPIVEISTSQFWALENSPPPSRTELQWERPSCIEEAGINSYIINPKGAVRVKVPVQVFLQVASQHCLRMLSAPAGSSWALHTAGQEDVSRNGTSAPHWFPLFEGFICEYTILK